MTGWIILFVVLLILAWILLTPVQARVSYERGELSAHVRYGLLKLQVFPLKKKEAGQESEKKPKKREKPEKKKKPKSRINREQIFYSLETLPPILTRALKRVGRRITVTPLRVYLLIVGSDPADTAALYGQLAAALANFLPVLQRLVRIREQEVCLYPDFTGGRIECAADVGVSIRPWDVLAIGICAGVSLLKWLLRFRKLAPPVEETEKEESSKEDQTTKTAA